MMTIRRTFDEFLNLAESISTQLLPRDIGSSHLGWIDSRDRGEGGSVRHFSLRTADANGGEDAT